MQRLQNEKGFAMVITLAVLVILTLVVLASLNTSVLDIQVAGNDRTTGEADFASKACQGLKAKQLIAGSGAPLPSTNIATNTNCQTDTPQVALFVPNISGYSAGIPGGYSLTQMRFTSTGTRTLNGLGSGAASSNQQAVVQVIQAH